eukprot:scaffold236890_cov21-Tisochrysis_lutea.AAC.1
MQSLQTLPSRSLVPISRGGNPIRCISNRIAVSPLPCASPASPSGNNESSAVCSAASRSSSGAAPFLLRSPCTLQRSSSLVSRAASVGSSGGEEGQVAAIADDSPGPLLSAFMRFSSLVTSLFPCKWRARVHTSCIDRITLTLAATSHKFS